MFRSILTLIGGLYDKATDEFVAHLWEDEHGCLYADNIIIGYGTKALNKYCTRERVAYEYL